MNVDRPEADAARRRELGAIARLGAAVALLAWAAVARAANVDLTVTALTGAPASARVGHTFPRPHGEIAEKTAVDPRSGRVVVTNQGPRPRGFEEQERWSGPREQHYGRRGSTKEAADARAHDRTKRGSP